MLPSCLSFSRGQFIPADFLLFLYHTCSFHGRVTYAFPLTFKEKKRTSKYNQSEVRVNKYTVLKEEEWAPFGEGEELSSYEDEELPYETIELDTHCGGYHCACWQVVPRPQPWERTPRLQKAQEAATPHLMLGCSHVFRGQVLFKTTALGLYFRDPDSSAPQFADYLYLGTTSIKNCCSFCSFRISSH